MSAAPILEEIYNQRQEDEVFILSNGHAGLALYCLLEQRYGVDPVELLHKHGIHPGKDLENHLYCSTGSLGSGLPIAVGHALATPHKKVWCMVSDGECAEGSIWESLAFIHKHPVDNLEVYANINGLGAYDSIDVENLASRLRAFLPRINIRISEPYDWSTAKGLQTHYSNLTTETFEELMK
ncbi:MAG TPA: thiamine pyrophosphate-dependent enzyme [Methanosarcina sp.]|nr:thiamine pyrophosphate-dependent enzyme [Methanosarcina sp.]